MLTSNHEVSVDMKQSMHSGKRQERAGGQKRSSRGPTTAGPLFIVEVHLEAGVLAVSASQRQQLFHARIAGAVA